MKKLRRRYGRSNGASAGYVDQVERILARRGVPFDRRVEADYLARCERSEIEPYVVADILANLARVRTRSLGA
jgi:hypothetical protein